MNSKNNRQCPYLNRCCRESSGPCNNATTYFCNPVKQTQAAENEERVSRSPSPVRSVRSSRSPSPVRSVRSSRSPSPVRLNSKTTLNNTIENLKRITECSGIDINESFTPMLNNFFKNMVASYGLEEENFKDIVQIAKEFDEPNSDSGIDFSNLSQMEAILKLSDYEDVALQMMNYDKILKNPSPNQKYANYLRLISYLYLGAEKFNTFNQNTLNQVEESDLNNNESSESSTDSMSENTEALRLD